MARRAVRRTPALATLLAVSAAVAGCGPVDVTRSRLEGAVGPTFANLYVVQQSLLGRPAGAASDVGARATCQKGGPGTPDEGAGEDWVCTVFGTVAFVRADGGVIQRLRYEVNAKPDGCYTATGAPQVVGLQTLQAPGGDTVVNPLYEFDGCFDTT
jgi:hypothetical protein